MRKPALLLSLFLALSFAQPQVILISPAHGAMPQNGSVQFSFSVSGSYPINCTLSVFDPVFGAIRTSVRITSPAPVSVFSAGLPSTIHVWNVSCSDSSGSSVSDSRQFLVKSYCMDGRCDASENCSTCASDCGECPPVCGNGECSKGETCSSCASDCGKCQPECVTDECVQACASNPDCIVWSRISCSGPQFIHIEAPGEIPARSSAHVKVLSGYRPFANAYVGVQQPNGSVAAYRTDSNGLFSYYLGEPGYYSYMLGCPSTSITGAPATYAYGNSAQPGSRELAFHTYISSPQALEIWVTEFGKPTAASLSIQSPRDGQGYTIITKAEISGHYEVNLTSPGTYTLVVSSPAAKSLGVRISLSSFFTSIALESAFQFRPSVQEICFLFGILFLLLLYLFRRQLAGLFGRRQAEM